MPMPYRPTRLQRFHAARNILPSTSAIYAFQRVRRPSAPMPNCDTVIFDRASPSRRVFASTVGCKRQSNDRGRLGTMISMSVDSLSFTVREVDSAQDMARVCELRASCYGRRAPALREPMSQPDVFDRSPSTSVFLCEDKVSGAAIGTMRVVDNTLGGDLDIEEFIEVPAWLSRTVRGEMTRLVVAPGADPLVKAALWKAGYLRCLQAQVQWLIIAARKPGLIKQYEYLGAKDMYADQRFVPVGRGWSSPHRIFIFNIETAKDDWYLGRHRLLRFMVETEHPDIHLPSVHRAAATAPRLSLVASA